MQPITRRGFLIAGAYVGAALAFSCAPRIRGPIGPSPRSAHAPLVVARGGDYAALLTAAVERLGGPRLLARPGESVLIKPTLAWRRTPGQGANVHPALLRAAIALALRGGARRVIVVERTSMAAAAVFQTNGAWQAVRAIGDPRVELVALADDQFVSFAELSVRLPEAAPTFTAVPEASLADCKVCRQLLEADRVINLAAARQHPTRGAALAMANLLGLIGGGPADAGWLKRQAAELALLSAAVRPELTILDATRPVVRNAPLGNDPTDIDHLDTMVVSRDPLAVEAFGATLLGLEPMALEHLVLAERLGLGSANIGRERLIALKEDSHA